MKFPRTFAIGVLVMVIAHLAPGDGEIDYKAYISTLTGLGYRGPVVVEVIVDVFDQPGYDPVKAAEHGWARVSPALG